MTGKRQKVTKVKCKPNESTTKQTVNICVTCSSLEGAFGFCQSSFAEEHKNFAIVDQRKHRVEQIYIWNPMNIGLIM